MRKVVRLGGLCVLTTWVGATLLGQGRSKKDRMVPLMEEYTNAPSPSDYENPVRNLLVRDLRSIGAEVSSHGLGSAIVIVHCPPY